MLSWATIGSVPFMYFRSEKGKFGCSSLGTITHHKYFFIFIVCLYYWPCFSNYKQISSFQFRNSWKLLWLFWHSTTCHLQQDDSTGEMMFDEVFHALSRCLAGLAQPFRVPGTDQLFKPKIFITILAYSSIIGLASHQVSTVGWT